jgi:predicted nucleic acid-binding protein
MSMPPAHHDPEPHRPTGIVLDTNTFVAAAFRPRSAAGELVERIRAGIFALVWHDETLRETRHVLHKIPPIRWEPFADLFEPRHRYPGDLLTAAYAYVPDPADRKFLALAEATHATLITRDRHLLTDRHRATVPILTATEFVGVNP